MSEPCYCLGCGYNLAQLTSDRCPECGRTFDPGDPATTLLRPRRMKPWNVALGMCFTLGIIGLIFGMTDPLVYVDVLAAVLILMVIAAGLWASCGPLAAITKSFIGRSCRDVNELSDRLRVLHQGRRLSWAAGGLSMLLVVIGSLPDMPQTPRAYASVIGISLLSLLYGVILAELVFTPLVTSTLSRANVPPTVARQHSRPEDGPPAN